jgi:hypothetical protein
MCECLHRAGARQISLKNVASTATFSLSIGKQVSFGNRLLVIRFVSFAFGLV